MNGCTDGDNDEGHEAGADHRPVEEISEAIVANRHTEQSDVDSRDSHVPAERVSASKHGLDSEIKMSRRTRSLETSAVLADRMSSEEAETVSVSEMVSGAASASEMEDDIENESEIQQTRDGANLKRTERRRPSRTRNADNGNEDSSDDNHTHEPVSTEDYRSQKSTNTEDYHSQKYIDTEEYRSQEISDTGSEQSDIISDLTGRSELAGSRRVGS